MKKIIFLLVVTLSLNSFTSLEKPTFNIVGKWRGDDKKEIGYIVFQADGYAYFEDSKGNKMGGKDFVENGKKANMTYKFDDSEALMKIDIIVKIVVIIIPFCNLNKYFYYKLFLSSKKLILLILFVLYLLK